VGPGQVVLSALPHPGREAAQILEILVGVAMGVVANLGISAWPGMYDPGD
jgi:hypothetical protein